METLTPMMKQFHDLKAKHPDALLLFRCGDFYETYGQDAVTASQVLGITLTRRSNGKSATSKATEMAGFPFHALDTYLPRLIRAGFRVAICDQLEDPKLTKKLVKRGITELITPGVTMDDNVLSSRENNFLGAVHFGKSSIGLSLLDISTGEFLLTEGIPETIEKLIQNFAPKEILVMRGTKSRFESLFGTRHYVYELDDWTFSDTTAHDKLLQQFRVKTLKGFGVDHLKTGLVASGAILCYLEITQHTHTSHITKIARIEEEHFVRIDAFTARNLELVAPMQAGGVSLLQIIDHTCTPMGARMLRRWLLFPLRSSADIAWRQDGTEYFFRDTDFRDLCDEELRKIGDLERITSKISTLRATPRELQQLRFALESIALIKQACAESNNDVIKQIGEQLETCPELHERLEHTLRLDPPALLSKGNFIADGANAELDDLRFISNSSKEYLQQLQQREAEATQIPSLKVGYSTVFGYYLEVRNTYKDRVPPEWTRKQTLAAAERYITQELKEYEEKILGAEDKIQALEMRIYGELLQYATTYIGTLQKNSQALSTLDCLFSAAATAQQHHYVRPIVDETRQIDIKLGRHPVIETLMPPGEEYVANDVFLDADSQQIIIITGPNMAGKSALLRQTALITLMAQMGSFVPAQSARIGMVDKIFTRVGASDNIALGESTFMNEMSEAANIMNNLTDRSLVLFDELGRGTSTYDGISIAWAIVEYLHEHPSAHARTLFATHYHELNEMQKSFARIKNFNVSVRETDGRIIFLRKLMPGGSEHSFGIHVAKLSGMPPSIVKRAEQILKDLENEQARSGRSVNVDKLSNNQQGATGSSQLSIFQLDDPVLEQIRDEMLNLDVDNLTPIEALNKLNEIKRIIKGR